MLPFKIDAQEKIAELKREIGFRERVYPRLVGKGKMSQGDADRRIEVMRSILEDYERGAR
ncbi:MAG: hypothetical protein AAF661_05145 [Pseudomonadota bacterium]